MPTNILNVSNIADALLTKTASMPAAGATAYTDAIDLDQDVGGTMENIALALESPAAPAGQVTYRFQHSTDGATYTDIKELASVPQLTADAQEWRVRLPPTALRYIRAAATVAAGGGDNTAKEFSLYLLT